MQNTRPILLIEDDSIDAMTVKRALKEHRVETALIHMVDGEDALEYLHSANGEKPCVILLDLHAPKMSGFDFLETIKADDSLKDIPIVVFSGSDEQDVTGRAFSLGASDYIIKSTEYTEFFESFGSILKFLTDSSELSAKG